MPASPNDISTSTGIVFGHVTTVQYLHGLSGVIFNPEFSSQPVNQIYKAHTIIVTNSSIYVHSLHPQPHRSFDDWLAFR